MPWKLSSEEKTVRLFVKVPASMKEWLERQPRGASATLRTLIRRAMTAQGKRDAKDLTL